MRGFLAVNTYRQGWYFYKEYSIITIMGLQ